MANSEPIIRLFFAKMKEAFINLPENEQQAFMRKDRDNLDQLGMKPVIMIDCRWSNDDWDYIGVEQWPTMESIDKRKLFEEEELEVYKYVESKVILGSPQSFTNYGK